jgi:hypothetical protein
MGAILIPYLLFILSAYFTKLIAWKKGIALFVLMFLIVAPIISCFIIVATVKIAPRDMENLDFDLVLNPSLSWKFLEKLGNTVGNNLYLEHLMPIISNLGL